MSSLFLRTLRDDPADAEVPSHTLLVRAGYVRRVAPGIYSWLPLGVQILARIEAVIREEMDAIGSQEVHFPALIPREIFEQSGRWADYGDGIFRLHDRKQADYLLGPTHEELFTLLVKGEYSSYKDLPLALYQIQTKYRDEARPRAGVLRGREFVMKDSYSFDLDDAGLEVSYRAHRDAYERIFTRLGMTYKIVYAVSGAMGGSASEEFLAPAPAGEDTFVQCTHCDYAANTEAVELAGPDPVDPSSHPPLSVLDTPDTPTIASLVAAAAAALPDRVVTAADTLKNVVLRTRQPGSDTWRLLVIGVPGDREVDLKRVAGQLEPTEVETATADHIEAAGLARGYIGPPGLGGAGIGNDTGIHTGRDAAGTGDDVDSDLAEPAIRYVVDPLVTPGSAWITGANAAGQHVADAVRGRDFDVDGELGAVEVQAGDRCPRCGHPVEIARGIEMGHVFQLGRKFADAFGLQVLGPDGKPVTVTMGSYGVGVTRAVAAIAEQTHDELGLRWPRSIAPYDVHVIATGKGDEPFDAAAALARSLADAGVRVLYDDRRGVSPGVKFKDAELLGMPTIVTCGRGLADGVVEVRDRATDERESVPVATAADVVAGRVRAAA